jgi:uncharacterized OsmC-like protein
LVAEVEGDIETDDGVLVIRRIRVGYQLRVPPDQAEAAMRAHDMHHPKCPVYRTLHGCVDISTALELTTGESPG